MFTVAGMAVFAHNALGEGSAGFALSCAAFHLILTWLGWRTGVYDSHYRPRSQPYPSTFLVTSGLFILSVFIPAPWRFVIWVPTLLIDLIILSLLWTNRNHEIQEQLNRVDKT